MKWALGLLGAAAIGCTPPAPPGVSADVSCVAGAPALRLRCVVRLSDRRTGRPVAGASVTLYADMPSMPLAHGVRPVTATSGPTAGTYEGTLELEMAGRWVIAARIAGPVTDQVTHVVDLGR